MFNAEIIICLFRELRNTCNYLLALTCAFEVLHQLSHFIFFGDVTFGSNFLDFLTCTKIQLLSVFGLICIQASLLAVAVDRLISTFAPIMYWNFINFKTYSICLFVSILSYKNLNRCASEKLLYLTANFIAIVAFGLYTCYYFYTTISAFSWRYCQFVS